MTQNRKIMFGGAQLFAGQIASQVLAFLRNFIVARLLVPEDFGVASTFAVTITALELLSDFSLEKIIVRDRKGDEKQFQATITMLNMLRYLILSAAIFFSAGWIANLFEVPEAKTAYQILAAVPIIRGFVHLDVFRMQREMNFTMEIVAHVGSQFAGLVVASILAYLTRDYTSVLWGVIAQSLVMVVITHIMAGRRYSLAFNREYAIAALIFGWPLMVNGIVLMLSTQADRVLVGAYLGMTDLAQYTIAALLVSVPGSSLYRIVSTLALPWLSKEQDNHGAFQSKYDTLGHVVGLIAVTVFVPIALIGSDVIAFAFGSGYLGNWVLIGWLAVAMAIRFMRCRIVNALLANGNTKDLMLSETARIVGIVLAYFALVMGGGLLEVGICMCIGEIVAYVVCIIRLNALKTGPVQTHVSTYGSAMIALAVAIMVLTLFPHSLLIRFGAACLIVAVFAGMQVMFVPAIRAQIRFLPEMASRMLQSRSGNP